MSAGKHENYANSNYFPGLDGIRCIAIIMVIWHHSPHPQSFALMSRGFLGVDLFFVLSGFLIVTLLLREKAKTGRISLFDFWMRRILRLVPAYYLLLFVLLGAYLLLKPGTPETDAMIRGFPVYTLYLSNWLDPGVPNLGITWSLATEEQFYLVWPVIEAFFLPFIAGIFWVFLIFINQLINFGLLDGIFETTFGVAASKHPAILDTTFTPILMGVGLAHIVHRPTGFALASRLAGFRLAAPLYASLMLALLCLPSADISGSMRLSFHILSILFLLAVLLSPHGETTRFLENKSVAFIGTISYGMYLYHMFALHGARAIASKLQLPEFPSVFLIGLMLTIIISSLSYFMLERKFLRLRSRFRAQRRAGTSTSVPEGRSLSSS